MDGGGAGVLAADCPDPRLLREDAEGLVACLESLDERVAADLDAIKELTPERLNSSHADDPDAFVYTLTDGRKVAISSYVRSGVTQFDLNGDGVYDIARVTVPGENVIAVILYDVNGDRIADFARADSRPFDGDLADHEIFAFDPSRGTWSGAVPDAPRTFSFTGSLPVSPPAFPFRLFYMGG